MEREHIVRCSCAGCCTMLRLEPYEDPFDHEHYVHVDVYMQDRRNSLRWRIGHAWNILLDRLSAGACLYLNRDEIARLRDYLNGLLIQHPDEVRWDGAAILGAGRSSGASVG